MEANGLIPILHLGKLRLACLTCSEPQGGESGPLVGTVASSSYRHSLPSQIPSVCTSPVAEWRPCEPSPLSCLLRILVLDH